MVDDEPGVAGTRLAHYRLLGRIGEGGMGRVYLAEDSRLERRVALKMLPAELAGDAALRERFVREAKLLAGLSHPGIVTVYSVERLEPPFPAWLPEASDGASFLTMELVEGRGLDAVIPAAGMAPDSFFDLALALLEAVAAAHDKQIVHRDLKPANVMVTGPDRVKVLDFGLAKSSRVLCDPDEDSPTEVLTTVGELIGTIAYMAPEQILGGPVDPRTDVFALGILLFEMATGRRPFRGQVPAEELAAILRDEPRRLGDLRADYPAAVSQLLERCLDKDPARRPSTAVEVRDELVASRDGQTCGAETRVCRIAVLPFADLSAAKDQGYFCDGLAEELINQLNRIARFRVASRASSFQFRDAGPDIGEIGSCLEVDAVLSGSVRKADERLRIRAELVDVASGYDIWSKSYDRTLRDVFRIQEEIAHSIVAALRVTISAEERRRIGHAGTRVADAYDFYLRGRDFFYQYNTRAMEFALEMFGRAIELDADFARAYAGIADCNTYLYANAERIEEHLDRALEAGRQALELDPELAEAHVALAMALSSSERPSEADMAFSQAIKANARLFEAHYFYARHCFVQGRAEEAVEHYARALELRPDDYQAPLLAAQSLDDLGRQREADEAREQGVRIAEERLRFSPDDTRALYMAANALVELGEKDRALEWAGRARRLEPDDPMVLYNLACIYSLAGEVEQALDCLEACLRHGFTFRGWAEQDSNLDAIRAHPRYRVLMVASQAAEPTPQ
jgi:TolB-like protein/Flp pilus assembly protein TadD